MLEVLLRIQKDLSCSDHGGRLFCMKCHIGYLLDEPLIVCEHEYPKIEAQGAALRLHQCPNAIHPSCHFRCSPWTSVLSETGESKTYCPSCALAVSSDTYFLRNNDKKVRGDIPDPILYHPDSLHWRAAAQQAGYVISAVVSEDLFAFEGQEPLNYNIDGYITYVLKTLNALALRPAGKYAHLNLDQLQAALLEVYPSQVGVESAITKQSAELHNAETARLALEPSDKTVSIILTSTVAARTYLTSPVAHTTKLVAPALDDLSYHSRGLLIDRENKLAIYCEPTVRTAVSVRTLIASLRATSKEKNHVDVLIPDQYSVIIAYGTRDDAVGGDCSVAALHMLMLFGLLPSDSRASLKRLVTGETKKLAKHFDCNILSALLMCQYNVLEHFF